MSKIIWKINPRMIAIVVDMIEHKTDGKIIDVGSVLPALASMPIIEVGRS